MPVSSLPATCSFPWLTKTAATGRHRSTPHSRASPISPECIQRSASSYVSSSSKLSCRDALNRPNRGCFPNSVHQLPHLIHRCPTSFGFPGTSNVLLVIYWFSLATPLSPSHSLSSTRRCHRLSPLAHVSGVIPVNFNCQCRPQMVRLSPRVEGT
jgi:hypothetical protein